MATRWSGGFPRLYAAASLKRHGPVGAWRRASAGFPRLYAAASLKPRDGGRQARVRPPGFSAALCRGLIEANDEDGAGRARCTFSAALCRGLIEAPQSGSRQIVQLRFSAALCRGLIEACWSERVASVSFSMFSAALCRGLIEALARSCCAWRMAVVFRGSMPRPH